jgi:hypothetical protein
MFELATLGILFALLWIGLGSTPTCRSAVESDLFR